VLGEVQGRSQAQGPEQAWPTRGVSSTDEDGEGESREERLVRIDRESPLPSLAAAAAKVPGKPKKAYAERFEVQVGSASGNGVPAAEPSLEIDLSPLEEYVRLFAAQAVKQVRVVDARHIVMYKPLPKKRWIHRHA
jgi:hypothetical protein